MNSPWNDHAGNPPHEPGCLGNHLGDCAVSGLFNFEGHQPRDCGEHRTVGAHRAWCHDCSEWCYPRIDMACKGCEIVQLRERLAAVELWMEHAERHYGPSIVTELRAAIAGLPVADHHPLTRPVGPVQADPHNGP